MNKRFIYKCLAISIAISTISAQGMLRRAAKTASNSAVSAFNLHINLGIKKTGIPLSMGQKNPNGQLNTKKDSKAKPKKGFKAKKNVKFNIDNRIVEPGTSSTISSSGKRTERANATTLANKSKTFLSPLQKLEHQLHMLQDAKAKKEAQAKIEQPKNLSAKAPKKQVKNIVTIADAQCKYAQKNPSKNAANLYSEFLSNMQNQLQQNQSIPGALSLPKNTNASRVPALKKSSAQIKTQPLKKQPKVQPKTSVPARVKSQPIKPKVTMPAQLKTQPQIQPTLVTPIKSVAQIAPQPCTALVPFSKPSSLIQVSKSTKVDVHTMQNLRLNPGLEAAYNRYVTAMPATRTHQSLALIPSQANQLIIPEAHKKYSYNGSASSQSRRDWHKPFLIGAGLGSAILTAIALNQSNKNQDLVGLDNLIIAAQNQSDLIPLLVDESLVKKQLAQNNAQPVANSDQPLLVYSFEDEEDNALLTHTSSTNSSGVMPHQKDNLATHGNKGKPAIIIYGSKFGGFHLGFIHRDYVDTQCGHDAQKSQSQHGGPGLLILSDPKNNAWYKWVTKLGKGQGHVGNKESQRLGTLRSTQVDSKRAHELGQPTSPRLLPGSQGQLSQPASQTQEVSPESPIDPKSTVGKVLTLQMMQAQQNEPAVQMDPQGTVFNGLKETLQEQAIRINGELILGAMQANRQTDLAWALGAQELMRMFGYYNNQLELVNKYIGYQGHEILVNGLNNIKNTIIGFIKMIRSLRKTA